MNELDEMVKRGAALVRVNRQGGKLTMSMIGRWLEDHSSELDALVAKIGKETGQRTTVEGMLRQIRQLHG